MKTTGLIFSILAILGVLLAMIPLLGWLNWLMIPFAVLALIFSIIGKGTPGIVMSILAIALGALRLVLGGGLL